MFVFVFHISPFIIGCSVNHTLCDGKPFVFVALPFPRGIRRVLRVACVASGVNQNYTQYLGNGVCNFANRPWLNTPACGFDGGDCTSSFPAIPALMSLCHFGGHFWRSLTCVWSQDYRQAACPPYRSDAGCMTACGSLRLCRNSIVPSFTARPSLESNTKTENTTGRLKVIPNRQKPSSLAKPSQKWCPRYLCVCVCVSGTLPTKSSL